MKPKACLEPSDATVIDAVVAEMRGLAPCDFTFQAASLFHLVALVQLAQRHPHLSGSHREFAQTFVAQARMYFADCPAVLDVIRRGNDLREDR